MLKFEFPTSGEAKIDFAALGWLEFIDRCPLASAMAQSSPYLESATFLVSDSQAELTGFYYDADIVGYPEKIQIRAINADGDWFEMVCEIEAYQAKPAQPLSVVFEFQSQVRRCEIRARAAKYPLRSIVFSFPKPGASESHSLFPSAMDQVLALS